MTHLLFVSSVSALSGEFALQTDRQSHLTVSSFFMRQTSFTVK